MSLFTSFKYQNNNAISVVTIYFGLRAGSIILLTILLLYSGSAPGQNVLSLKQAINSGFLKRKTIQSGKSDLIIMKLQTEALYKKYLPQISVEYNYLYNPILQTSVLPIGVFNSAYPADAKMNLRFGTTWSQTAGVTVLQPLIDFSIARRINESKLQERITAASQAQTEYEMAFSIAQTYIQIGLQESKIKSAIADTSRTFISYLILNNKYNEKRLLKSDLNKSIINHNNAVEQLMDALSEMIEDKVYLLFLTGETAVEKTDFIISPSSGNPYNLTTSGLISNPEAIPEFQQLELESQLTSLKARSENTKQLPTLSIKGFLGANQYTNKFDPIESNTWFGLSYIGLDLKLPLLFGESVKKNKQVLRIQSTQFNQQKDDKSAIYAKDTYISKLKIARILLQLKTQEENLALSIESIAITQARVTEGQESGSTLNVDEASLQSLKAEYELTKMQLWNNYLNVLKTTGHLNILWK